MEKFLRLSDEFTPEAHAPHFAEYFSEGEDAALKSA